VAIRCSPTAAAHQVYASFYPTPSPAPKPWSHLARGDVRRQARVPREGGEVVGRQEHRVPREAQPQVVLHVQGGQLRRLLRRNAVESGFSTNC